MLNGKVFVDQGLGRGATFIGSLCSPISSPKGPSILLMLALVRLRGIAGGTTASLVCGTIPPSTCSLS